MKKIGSDTRSGVGYSGLDSLSASTERLQQSVQFEAQSAAQRNQIAQTTIQGLSSASQGRAGAELNKISAETAFEQRKADAKNAPGGNAIGQIAQALGGAASVYMNVKAKDRELDVMESQVVAQRQAAQAKADAEQLAAERDENFTRAKDELQSHIFSNTKDGRLTAEIGTSQFKTTGLSILDKYDLDESARRELAGSLYSTITGVTEKEMAAKKDYLDKLKATSTDVVIQQLQVELTNTLVDMGSLDEGTRDSAMGNMQAVLADAISRTDLDPIEKNLIVSTTLKSALSYYQEGSKQHQQLQEQYSGMMQLMQEQNLADEKVRSGEWDMNQRNLYIQKKAMDLHVEGDFVKTNPYAADDLAIENGERQAKFKSIEEARIIDASMSWDLKNDEIGTLAVQMLTDPSLIEKWKADPRTRENPSVKTALDLQEKYRKIQKENIDIDLQRQDLLSSLTQKNESDYKWLLNQSRSSKDPTLTALMAAAKIDISAMPQEETGATPEQLAEVERLSAQYKESIREKAAQLQTKKLNNIAELKPYGLDADETVLKKMLPERVKSLNTKVNAHYETYEASQTKPAGIGIASPTRAGGKTPAFGGVKTLAQQKVAYGDIVLPFKAGTPFTGVTDLNYKEDRGSHAHAGEDLGIALGTPLVAYVGGVVTQVRFQPGTRKNPGYGQYVTIKGDDGKYHRFAHLTKGSPIYKEGSRVEAGQVFAKSGNTGNGVTHLHWEVRNDDDFGIKGTVNPYEYMATQVKKTSSLTRPRGKDLGYEYEPGRIQPRIPVGALPMGAGTYWYKGKLGQVADSSYTADASQKFNAAKPLSTGYMSNNKSTYAKNEPGNNYQYSVLAKDKPFASKLAKTADRLGIPAVWLADVIAFETGGTFSPGIPNQGGSGAMGLIQFMPATARGLGTSTAALAKMSRTQQLDYVEKYLTPMKAHIGKGIDYLYMAINGGSGNLAKMVKGKNMAGMSDTSSSWSGGGTFASHMQKIGSHAGRIYETQFSRKDRLTATTHTSYNSSCKTCNHMRQSADKITPHKAQNG